MNETQKYMKTYVAGVNFKIKQNLELRIMCISDM